MDRENAWEESCCPGQILSALGQKLHPSCFVCCVCGKGLGQSFLETEGKPFCIDCYSNEKAEVCRRCNQPIVPLEDGEQQIVRTETGSAYHSDCYNCVRCYISLLGKPAYSMEDEVVCATCRDDLVDEKVRRQTAIEKAKAMKCDDVSWRIKHIVYHFTWNCIHKQIKCVTNI